MNRLEARILRFLPEEKRFLHQIYSKFLDDHAYLWDEVENLDLARLRYILFVIIKLFYEEHKHLQGVNQIDQQEFNRAVRELIANPDALLQKAQKAQIKEIDRLGLERWFNAFRKDIERINQIIQKYEKTHEKEPSILSQFPDLRQDCKILGLPEKATLKQARSAFRRIALRTHPDRFPGDMGKEARFKEATLAYRRIENKFEGKTTPGKEKAQDVVDNARFFFHYGLRGARILDLKILGDSLWGLRFNLGPAAKEMIDHICNEAIQSLVNRIRHHDAPITLDEIMNNDSKIYDFLKANSQISLEPIRNEVAAIINRCTQEIIECIKSRGEVRKGYAANLVIQTSIDNITSTGVIQLQQLANKYDLDISSSIANIKISIQRGASRSRLNTPFARAKNRLAAIITGKRIKEKVVVPFVKRLYGPAIPNSDYAKSLVALSQLIEAAVMHGKENYNFGLLESDIDKIIRLLELRRDLLEYQQPRDLLYQLTGYLATESISFINAYPNMSAGRINLFLSIVKEAGLNSDPPVNNQSLGYIEALVEEIEIHFKNNIRNFVIRDLNQLRNLIEIIGLRSNLQALGYIVKCLEVIAKYAIKEIKLGYLSLSDSTLIIFAENAEFYNLKSAKEVQIVVASINSAFDNRIRYYENQRLQSFVTKVHQYKEKFNAMYEGVS